jgi:RsiW-degrading membrane proteinase PrsW (M82 family)
MMNLETDALLVALGLLPSLVWMFIFLKKDDHPEPKSLIAKTFLMGIIISPIAVALQIGFTKVGGNWGPVDYFVADGSFFFLWAAFVEEFVKYYAVRLVALTDPAFDEPVDAMIYMMMAGLGFAAIENILVLFRTIPNGVHATILVWSLRSMGATLLHALSCALVGYFLALSWFFQHHRKKLIVLGLMVATLFHFTFNLFLAAADNQLRGLLLSVSLLCVMAFLVSILFDKIKARHTGVSAHLSKATEKEISAA